MGDLPTQLQDFRMHSIPQRNDASFVEGNADESRLNGGDGTIVSIAEMERNAILGTIKQLNGDKLMAARLLGIGKTTLYRKLKEYGISEGLGD
jgi:two-component system response regulator HydG